jgi:hypothetical protein
MRPGAQVLEFRHHQRLRARLCARLAVEQQLIEDARSRGWAREVERHEATRRRIEQLLRDLAGDSDTTTPAGPAQGQEDRA